MKISKLFAVVAVALTGAVALAQEAVRRLATPEMSATDLCLVAQDAMDDERRMIEGCDRREAEEFTTISEAITKSLASADDVTSVAVRTDVAEHRMTGTVWTFNYLGRPVWMMFVQKDTGRGYQGEKQLWFKASGRAAKDNEEARLLSMAPVVFNYEMDHNVRSELRRRFGYDSGNVGQLNVFMVQEKMEPTLQTKLEEVFSGLRKIGDDYRAVQTSPKK